MCNDSVDILVSQGLEEIAGMVRLVPQERGKRIVVDMPVPQLVQRTVEQMPVRQMLEEAVEVMDVVPRCMVGVQVRQNRDAGFSGETTKWTSGRKALSSPATQALTQSASGPSPVCCRCSCFSKFFRALQEVILSSPLRVQRQTNEHAVDVPAHHFFCKRSLR